MVIPGGLIALVFIFCFIDLNSINFIIEISGKIAKKASIVI